MENEVMIGQTENDLMKKINEYRASIGRVMLDLSKFI
jgi:hypothetical protein